MNSKEKNSMITAEEFFDTLLEYVKPADILASKNLTAISTEIIRKRLELNMTQKLFAKYMNVSQSMISKWENAEYNFTIKTLSEVCAKLDIDFNIDFARKKAQSTSQNIDFCVRQQSWQYELYESEATSDYAEAV